jgi:hypothetical protein
MVDVFKTNVQHAEQANRLVLILNEYFPNSKINFDLEDCDKILRVQHQGISTPEISIVLRDLGYDCVPLQD